MILRNGELLSFQNGIMRYHYCEFSKNGENSKNDDYNQVNHLIPTRVLVKGGEITCKILK